MERLEIHGEQGLTLSPVRNCTLRVLRIESCGLPSGIVQAVADSDLPNLEYLDLWLGVDQGLSYDDAQGTEHWDENAPWLYAVVGHLHGG
ncbi:hypothetical protein ABZV14_44635 [Streptosporangium canum]|uniref:hypothetical protein n=1 Tax=Streptosporangium canum TaxID=324952 RepID=UPI0033AD5144